MEIAIPSKGRPQFVARLFFDKATVFVEPQDYELYKKENPDMKLVNIEANDKGVAYVYNFILNHMQGKFFLIDDDVQNLFVREGTTLGGYPRLVKVTERSKLPWILEEFELRMAQYDLAMLCLKENYANWYRKRAIDFATVGYRAICLDADLIKKANIRFDETLLFHNDTDFYIQIFTKGLRAGVYNQYAFSHDAKNEHGGCNFLKTQEAIEEDAKRCVNKWHNPHIKMSFDTMLKQMGVPVEWRKICPFNYWEKICV